MLSSNIRLQRAITLVLVLWAATATRADPPAQPGSRRPRSPQNRLPAQAATTNQFTPAGSPAPDEQDPQSSLLASVDQQRRLANELVRAEVESELRQARARLAADPATVEKDLKRMIERVAAAPELNPEVRSHLRSILENAVRDCHRRAATKEITDQQIQQAGEAARDQLRDAASVMRDQEKTRQRVARYQSLMEEGHYAEAGSEISAAARSAGPDPSIANSAPLVAHAIDGRAAVLAMRTAGQGAVLDALASVEKSANPTPDDQCIIYQDAEAWRRLTDRRKRYVHVDMKKLSPAEAKIQNVLKETTTFDFDNVTLQDIADCLTDRYGIEVLLDTRALDNAGFASDALVKSKLKGISFRSALRLTLRPMNLAYMMKDEALLITTPDVADHEMVVKVYPVDDLVVPIRPCR